jgi:hypothetical protein
MKIIKKIVIIILLIFLTLGSSVGVSLILSDIDFSVNTKLIIRTIVFIAALLGTIKLYSWSTNDK